jgi:hypothetical protein
MSKPYITHTTTDNKVKSIDALITVTLALLGYRESTSILDREFSNGSRTISIDFLSIYTFEERLKQ